MSQEIIQNGSISIRAELDVQIVTAKQYPRDVMKSLATAISIATMDEETASECFYMLGREDKTSRTKKIIEGPSIRLAEIMMSCWGNLHTATRIVGNNGKSITAEGAAWDLENNNKISAEVVRNITTREGRTFSNDMQIVTGNAAASIALRNAIFRVIPKAVVNRVLAEAKKTVAGEQTTLDKRRIELFAKFKKNWNIEPDTILSFFKKKNITEITVEEYVEIIGIGNSIKEGLTSIEDAFNVNATDKSNKAAALNEALALKETKQPDNTGEKSTKAIADDFFGDEATPQ